MISNPAAKHAPSRGLIVAAMGCAIAGLVLFHFFGNATRGYVKTTSVFWWWVSQWIDPNAETQHGWLILGLSSWLLWKNLSIADRGLRIAEIAKPEAGEPTKPELLNRRPETGDQNPGTSRGESDEVQERDSFAVLAPESANPQFAIRNPQSASRPQSASGLSAPFAAMMGGLALHALGFAAQQTRLSIIACLVFAWGVLRLYGGRRWGKAALFPLAFMIFAIPLSALDEIGLPLRVWVTNAGERIAHLAGIEVVRSGTQLVAPDGRFNYDVAAPCSGVRSLMALTALSVLLGYLNFRTWGRRALVLGLCLPLVYVGNVMRIVAIIFAAQAGGSAWGDRAHQVMGYGVFVIVLGGLLLGVALIHRWWPETLLRSEGRVEGAGGEMPLKRWISDRRVCMVTVTVVALSVAEMFFLHRLSQMPARGQVGVVLAADGLNPVELPAFLGTEWIGQRSEVSAVEREILPADTGFSRKNYAFVPDRTRDVFLSIVLSGRDRTSIHRPELCLVGQGWTIERGTEQTFRSSKSDVGQENSFRATVLRVRREIPSGRGKVVVPQLIAYWFVGGNRVVSSNWQRFVQDAWNRITRARADRWAYVLMQTDARDGEAAALARMQTVIDGTLHVFQKPTLLQ
jgi:exosortase